MKQGLGSDNGVDNFAADNMVDAMNAMHLQNET